MAKKYKLVYEDQGVIKGSYSGIPSKDDAELIPRDVLEGKKPAPKPQPEPTGTIEITENGLIDVKEFAQADVNVPSVEPVGNKEITTTEQVDVKDFATAQVSEPNLVAENIKKDVSILGVTGTLVEPSGKAPKITANGTNIDIKNFAAVDVEVPTPVETYEQFSTYMTDEDGKIITDEYMSGGGLLYTNPTAPEIKSVDLYPYNYYYYEGDDDFNTLGGLGGEGVYH